MKLSEMRRIKSGVNSSPSGGFVRRMIPWTRSMR